MAVLRPERAPPLPPDAARAGMRPARAVLEALRTLAPPVILIVAVLGSILAGIATPTEAAGVGALGALMLAGHRIGRDEGRGRAVPLAGLSLVLLLVLTSLVDLRVNRDLIPPGDRIGIAAALVLCAGAAWGVGAALLRVWRAGVLREVMEGTARLTAMVFTIVIGAALFSLVFRGLGGDETVHGWLTALPGGVVGAMVVVMAVMFLMGFFLDFVEITLVVVPIVAPILLAMGVDPVWLGVMMAVNLQTSFLTPPFGFALFYLRGVAPDTIRTADIYRGAVPFVAIQMIGLGLVAAFPALATWLPEVVFG
jgi:TRAP-type mannitol/chloroaromatic compound transport system permease large subunit